MPRRRHERRLVDPYAVPYPGRGVIVVRNFRHLRNWSQALAAAWYGVSERTWQRYEAGDVPVPAPLRKRITSYRERTATGAEHAIYLTF